MYRFWGYKCSSMYYEFGENIFHLYHQKCCWGPSTWTYRVWSLGRPLNSLGGRLFIPLPSKLLEGKQIQETACKWNGGKINRTACMCMHAYTHIHVLGMSKWVTLFFHVCVWVPGRELTCIQGSGWLSRCLLGEQWCHYCSNACMEQESPSC